MNQDKTSLIVVSKAKQLMKEKDVSVSKHVLEVLSQEVMEKLLIAGEKVKKDRRRVIQVRDLNK